MTAYCSALLGGKRKRAFKQLYVPADSLRNGKVQ